MSWGRGGRRGLSFGIVQRGNAVVCATGLSLSGVSMSGCFRLCCLASGAQQDSKRYLSFLHVRKQEQRLQCVLSKSSSAAVDPCGPL